MSSDFRHTILFLCLVLIGCDKSSKLMSELSQSSKAISIEYNPDKAKYKAFSTATGSEVYVGDLSSDGTNLKVPQALVNGLYGDRSSLFDPQPLDLIIRGYLIDGSTNYNDFYFEVPIIAPVVEINSINTALTVLLRNSISPTPKINRQNWVRLAKSVEFFCPECTNSSFSFVLNKIKSEEKFLIEIKNLLKEDNPNTLFTINWNLIPPYLVAWSFPILENNISSELKTTEGVEVESNLTLVSTRNSSQRIAPSAWVLRKETAPDSGVITDHSTAQGDFRYTKMMENGWAQRSIVKIVLAAKNELPDAAVAEYQFKYQLEFSNRKPIFSTDKTLTFKMNHYYEFDLDSLGFAADPDGTTLTYQCVTCPVGLVTSGSKVGWAPTSDVAQVGNMQITLKAVDADRTAEIGTVNINVLPDSAPQILSVSVDGINIPSNGTANLDENTLYNIRVTAFDPDTEDVLTLDTSGLLFSGILLNGDTLRGEASDVGLRNLIVTKVGPNYEINFDIKPSYFQVVDLANINLLIRFWVNYDAAALDVNGKQLFIPLTVPAQNTVYFNFFNKDDAPVFFKGNTDPYFVGPFITQVYNSGSGLNDGLPINQGTTVDIRVNFASLADYAQIGSTITYSIDRFDTVRGLTDSVTTSCGTVYSISGDIFTWNVPYTTPVSGNCSLLLIATNSNGLITTSTIPGNFIATKVNLPPTEANPIPVIVDFNEGNATSNVYALDSFIIDPNSDDLVYTWTCDLGAPIPPSKTFRSACPNTDPVLLGLTTMSWMPDYNIGTSDINEVIPYNVTATDPNGSTYSKYLYLHVNNVPAPPIVTLAPTFTTEENSSAGFSMTVSPYKANGTNVDLIDQYNFSVVHNCDASINAKIVAPTPNTGFTGSGDQSFTYIVGLLGDYNKGTAPIGYKTYGCTFTIANDDNPMIIFPDTYNTTIRVDNKNRPPTGIIASLNSNISSPSTIFNFDYLKTLKVIIYIKINDLDGTGDTYTLTGPTFGGAGKVEATATNGIYKYTLDFSSTSLNCLTTGTSTVEKKTTSFTFTYKDAATTSQNATNLILRINKVKPGSCF